jgi:monoamine oxidase
MARLTDALADGLGDSLRLGHVVRAVIPQPDGVVLEGDGFTFEARHAVLALPPRLAAGLGLAVPDIPTWMAGHAKLVAIFDAPFWRAAGLNGDAVSHRGPLAEIHDASPECAEEGALFGFAVPGAARRRDFRDAAIAQLALLFGAEAGRPRTVLVKDWSADPATATGADLHPPTAHPAYRPLPSTARVIFAGTETAVTEGGFLEGALEAAEAAERDLARIAAPPINPPRQPYGVR